ncbi:uncharacterized protein EI90DRAFT_3115977 [Cantharellus anzutake]|uniref:uncharacterized protein n=1 Tax=Cantharellus anzutake TaxID=1750568 RepID=UPI00190780D1|nr:uncharacterized protein EI90DRAFT_3115977 [Cantharellus anzutake]KAF8342102.1 hypothetical protein EI90DRAFT_3115977 [Cantharellus anzutake]
MKTQFNRVKTWLPRKGSNKKTWAHLHKRFVVRVQNDPDYLLVYSDGSRIVIGGADKYGYGVVGFTDSVEVFQASDGQNGGMILFEAEMKGFQLAAERIRQYLDDPSTTQPPTRVYVFGDDVDSLRRILRSKPNKGEQYARAFRRAIEAVLSNRPHLQVTVGWSPSHCGIRGNSGLAKQSARNA